MSEKPKLEVVTPPSEPTTIQKPVKFDLSRFKSQSSASADSVETLLTALPHHSLSQARDFVRLHSDQKAYWSDELCFVSVPILGQKSNLLHLIDETVALRHLRPAKIQRFRLALATKPHDSFFLCHVPSQNLDNLWNATNLEACEQARTLWTTATSLKAAGMEKYKVDKSRDQDAFPATKWPSQTLNELITVTFDDLMIMTDDHPGLLRLVGAKPPVS